METVKIKAIRSDCRETDARWPERLGWNDAPSVRFCSDWRGENPDPRRETEARLLWSDRFLFIQFLCHYRRIYAYDGKNERRDRLWDRDVAELFIRPGSDVPGHYKEFEIAPNGDWLDLDIDHGEKSILHCDLKSRVRVNARDSVWSAELAIPFNCLAPEFHKDEIWRINLFRIEGPETDRFYSAWCPTYTTKPNFHVPECFGELHFVDA